MKRIAILPCIVLLIGVFSMPSSTAQDAKEAIVSRQDLHPELTVQGTVIAKDLVELKLEFNVFKGALKIKRIAKQGVEVKQGDQLVAFDLEKIQDSLDDSNRAEESARDAMKRAEVSLELFTESTENKLRALEQKWNDQKQGFDYYKKIKGPNDLEASELALKRSAARMANAREELEQLEKMYKESDLAVDTQEIVLHRSRRDLGFQEIGFTLAEERYNRLVQYGQPKTLRDLQQGVASAEIAFRHAKENSKLDVKKKFDDITRAILTLHKAEKKAGDLQADLDSATLLAPRNGILIHGALVKNIQNRASGISGFFRGIKTGDPFTSGQVLCTIYDPSQYQILFQIPEGKLNLCSVGLLAECSLPALPGSVLEGKISTIAFLPEMAGKEKLYWASAFLLNKNVDCRPGMSASLQIKLKKITDVLALPSRFVHQDGIQYYCILSNGEKRTVVTGIRDGELIQIVGGLQEGDIVSIESESK